MSSDVCRMCGQTREWHEQNHPRHPFTSQDGASSPTLTREEPPDQIKPRPIDLPFDPILRLALVNAGVITAEQLSQAEKDFFAINGGSHGREGSKETGLPQRH